MIRKTNDGIRSSMLTGSEGHQPSPGQRSPTLMKCSIVKEKCSLQKQQYTTISMSARREPVSSRRANITWCEGRKEKHSCQLTVNRLFLALTETDSDLISSTLPQNRAAFTARAPWIDFRVFRSAWHLTQFCANVHLFPESFSSDFQR